MRYLYQSATATDAMAHFNQTQALISLAAALGILMLAAVPGVVLHGSHSRRADRRTYWTATVAAGLALFLGSLPDWRTGIGMIIFTFTGMAFAAYIYTPYIKIHDKIFAFNAADRLPDPPPEELLATAPRNADRDRSPNLQGHHSQLNRNWWALVIFCVLLEINFIADVTGRHSGPWGLLSPIIFVAICISLGYIDAKYDYRIARGQRQPFGVVTLATAGCFAVLYLAAYYSRKRYVETPD